MPGKHMSCIYIALDLIKLYYVYIKKELLLYCFIWEHNIMCLFLWDILNKLNLTLYCVAIHVLSNMWGNPNRFSHLKRRIFLTCDQC